MQKHRTLQSILILGVLTISTGILFTSRLTAADGEWKQPADGDWNDPASWTGGVPAAGDVATFGDFPEGDATIILDGPTAVGTLRSLNAHLLTFSGDVLVFDSGVAGTAAVIDIPGVGGALQLDGELDLQSELVVGPSGAYRSVSFNGSILAGNHGLALDGGTLTLAGDNSAWSGDVVVNGGTLQVTHASGLGDLIGETFINGGQLTLSVPTSETLHLNGGKVFLASADHANAIDASGGTIFGVHAALTGELQLSGGTTTVQGVGLALSGEVTGAGNLHFAETRRGLIEINHPLSHTGTTSFDGLVNINVGGNVFQNQDLVFEGGTVTIGAGATESVQAGTVLMRGTSSLTRAAGVDPSVGFSFSGPFTYESGTIGVPLQGTGSFIKTGPGTLTLDQDNSYTGQTVINEGTVVIDHTNGLGSTAGDTLLNGGTLVINNATEEPIALEAGLLTTSQFYTELSGPLILNAGNTAVVQGPLKIRGGTTGDGDLHLVATEGAAASVWDEPLNHVGGVYLSTKETFQQGVVFRVDNGYLGPTEVSFMRLVVRTPNGLGSPVSGTVVTKKGELRLHGASQESVSLTDSTLALWSAETVLDELTAGGVFTLKDSTITTYGEYRGAENYVVEQPIHLDGGLNTIKTERGQLTLAGGVTGVGDLLLYAGSDPINIRGPISHTGSLEIRGEGVQFQFPNAYDGTVLLRNWGRMVVEAPQEMDRILTMMEGSIEVAPGSFLAANSIQLVAGKIKGEVRTDGPLKFKGYELRTISHLGPHANVQVFGGELEIDDTDPAYLPTSGSVSLNRKSESQITMTPNSMTDLDLYLNNGTGYGFGGALWGESNSTDPIVLTGDIYLGDQGASIGGQSTFRAEGRIHGGNLTLGPRGFGNLQFAIVTAPQPYVGRTSIHRGRLVLAESGRLSNTSEIETFNGGGLNIDAMTSDGPNLDRVDDNLRISMHGGEVSVWPLEWYLNTTERLGHVSLERGISFLRGITFYGSGDLEATAKLVIGTLTREEGSLLDMGIGLGNRRTDIGDLDQGASNLFLENPPPVINGILPAWFSVGGASFASYGPNGVEPAPLERIPIAEANSTTNLFVQGTEVLVGDTTLNSATGRDGSVLELNGHTLTVGSGGLINAKILNGKIEAGDHADNELIIRRGFIDAEIMDGQEPLSVTYVGDVEVHGSNTYTGRTYVTRGQVDIRNVNALPSGGDVAISSGLLALRDLRGNVAYRLGSVTIRDGGTLSVQCCGNGDTFSADSIELESGTLAAPLVGDIPIAKTTEGLALISRPSPDFKGTIEVFDGILQLGTSRYFDLGQTGITVHPGGRLVLSTSEWSGSASPLLVTLKGGALYPSGPSSKSISLLGSIEVAEDSFIYLQDGIATSTEGRGLRIDGQIHVSANRSLSVSGRIGSTLLVSDGIHLDPGAMITGSGSIRARVGIANRAILSPGDESSGSAIGRLKIVRPSASDPQDYAMAWGEDGHYRWEISNAIGEAGSFYGDGWDLMVIAGDLAITATESNPFVIDITGIDDDNHAGAIANFFPDETYRWQIAEANSFIEFDADKFSLVDHGALAGTKFWIEQDGNSIYLNVTAVPEPTVWALLGTGVLALSLLARRSLAELQ